MGKKDKDDKGKRDDEHRGGNYDTNYAEYKAMNSRIGIGNAMTPEQWKAANESEE